MLRTLVNLQRVEPGFNMRNLLLFRIQPGMIGYKDEKLEQLYQQIAERLEAVPGVRAVTFSDVPVLAQWSNASDVYLRNDLAAAPDSEGRIKPSGPSYVLHVRENFLEAIEIPLLSGRSLQARDDTRAPKVAVVNQTFANKYFPYENPVGKRFTFSSSKKLDEIEIIGRHQ
ncbi:MAG: ABC transporter permease [Pyrinomonadaceae bacterium]